MQEGYYLMNRNQKYVWRIIGVCTNGNYVMESMFSNCPVNTYPVYTELYPKQVIKLVKEHLLTLVKAVKDHNDETWVYPYDSFNSDDRYSSVNAIKYLKRL